MKIFYVLRHCDSIGAMSYIIFGLGNKGDEYKNTRHNTGRIVIDLFRKKEKFSSWEVKKSALISKGKIGKHSVVLVLPELMMNRSGIVLKDFIVSAKKAESLIVVHDDLDLGFGSCKISFGRGPGGHKGVKSIITHIKTKNFIRVRVGISPITLKGKIKKPKGEKKVLDFILAPFNKKETDMLPKLSNVPVKVLTTIVEEGRAQAMNLYN